MPTLVSESRTIRRELWTADDFLEWLEPGVHADLIDGEKTMHSPVSLRHADLTNFLDFLLAPSGIGPPDPKAGRRPPTDPDERN